MKKVGGGLDLHLELRLEPGRPTGRGLEQALREAIRSGRLATGTRLPGTRSLAGDLGVARGTVVQVYSQLVAEGWLVGNPGAGTQVAAVNTAAAATAAAAAAAATIGAGTAATAATGTAATVTAATVTGTGATGTGATGTAATGPGVAGIAGIAGLAVGASRPGPVSTGVLSLQAGRPDLSLFPRRMWAASTRRVLAEAGNESFDYPSPAGVPALRAAVAEYVARARGVHATVEDVVITAGFSHGLALLARMFRELGVDRVSMENPGLGRHRRLVQAAGLEVSPLAVDASGADPDDVQGQVAVLTPAHQHPRGAVLAPERRMRFVEWARDGFVVEDDYDGEFRYDQQPVGAMQALAPDRVIFAGCASKSLAPGVRLGWLVVPPVLRKPLLNAIISTGSGVSSIEQLVMADLITRGDYDRHIRKVRLEYRRRRTELADRVAAVWPYPLEGIAAGMHALLPLESAAEEWRLIDVAQYGGLSVHGLHTMGYWHTEDDSQPAALVLGYATPPPHAWRTALDRLAELLQATNPERHDG
ncbi:PLP-dependent aminotransferase family protein [Kribbella sp. NBC_00382]|uniref:aminotransferase-like domain-containing protein n=1 Tax=Kribbella sp. NBC_00382 TaxID=2975967 RepID=UPI002E1A1E8B